MNQFNERHALDMIKMHEGFSATPYYDTADPPALTIGYGTNIERISEAEGEMLLRYRYSIVIAELDRHKPQWRYFPSKVQNGLADMAYNLGLPRLLKFVKMWAALEAGDFATAADEALDSKWARQVGNRADHIADEIRSAA